MTSGSAGWSQVHADGAAADRCDASAVATRHSCTKAVAVLGYSEAARGVYIVEVLPDIIVSLDKAVWG